MIINHNMNALNAHRMMAGNTATAGKSMEKLSSGLRINRAGDDAAGLAISEKMRGQIRGLDQAGRNAQDGISLIQTAEGALNETHSILQRMRELAVQSSNDTNVEVDRNAIQTEMNQLVEEIDRIANTTEFNTRTLLNGGAGLKTTFSAEKVGLGNVNWISVVGGTSDTKTTTAAGDTAITISAATAATVATTTVVVDVNASATQTFTLNGHTFSFTADSTDQVANASTIVALINTKSDETGVTAAVSSTDTDRIILKTTTEGSSADIRLTAAASKFGNAALAIGPGTVKGADATITVDNEIAASNYVASGNNIEVVSGDYKGLKLRLNGSVMSSTNTNNTASFTIDANNSVSMQIGANEGQDMEVSISDMRSEALGVNNLNVTTSSNAKTAITTINDAITSVSTERSKLGAYQNRLEHTIANLGTSSENLQSAESRIRDVDMAKEMMQFSKNNILSQAAQAMLAQANQQPQGVLQLLR